MGSRNRKKVKIQTTSYTGRQEKAESVSLHIHLCQPFAVSSVYCNNSACQNVLLVTIPILTKTFYAVYLLLKYSCIYILLINISSYLVKIKIQNNALDINRNKFIWKMEICNTKYLTQMRTFHPLRLSKRTEAKLDHD